MIKRSQIIVEALTWVKKVDLGVRPDPGALLIGLIMPYGRAQDHDVLKEPPVGAFEQIQDEHCFFHIPSVRISSPNGPFAARVNKLLRRTGHLQY